MSKNDLSPSATDCESIRSVLTELLRLYDWRNELGRIERDFNHDKKQVKTWLNQYGREKKTAWEAARRVLSAPSEIVPNSILAELAAIADDVCDLHQNRDRPDDGPIMQWDSSALTLGTLRKAKALRDTARSAIAEPKPHLAPKDANGKRPRLFYWEEAEDCWCPADGYELTVANIIDAEQFLADGEEIEIRFKRQDMTDEEHDAIPEG